MSNLHSHHHSSEWCIPFWMCLLWIFATIVLHLEHFWPPSSRCYPCFQICTGVFCQEKRGKKKMKLCCRATLLVKVNHTTGKEASEALWERQLTVYKLRYNKLTLCLKWLHHCLWSRLSRISWCSSLISMQGCALVVSGWLRRPGYFWAAWLTLFYESWQVRAVHPRFPR